jgi:hypothetical protein
MASYAYSVDLDSVELASQTGTVGEKFSHTMLLGAGDSDTSLVLGAITDPKYIIVVGAKGVSFKLGAAGTDVIGANPIAIVADEDGLSETQILLSNSDSQEHEVQVYAGE